MAHAFFMIVLTLMCGTLMHARNRIILAMTVRAAAGSRSEPAALRAAAERAADPINALSRLL